MAQHNKICSKCGEAGHSKFYCKNTPRKPIAQVSPKRKAAEATESGRKKPKKKSPRTKAKEAAWSAFSYYIRIRDSLLTTGTLEYCVCVTCRERGIEEWKEFKRIQAGHAVGGRGNAVLFHEEIVNGQCDYCNNQGKAGLSGDYGNYAIFLVKKFGLEYAEELQKLKHKTDVIYKIHDFVEIERVYKEKAAELIHLYKTGKIVPPKQDRR